MKDKKFRIFATDGERIWELLFITQNRKGDFYFGPVISGFSCKFSRHISGKMHFKAKEPELYEKLGKRQKLDEFKGVEQLLCFGISVDSFKNGSFKSYKWKKSDGSVVIDIRNYQRGFNVMPFLLASDQTNILENLAKSFPNCQIVIFTQTRPWIVLLIHGW
jgi:hypothetical protein